MKIMKNKRTIILIITGLILSILIAFYFLSKKTMDIKTVLGKNDFEIVKTYKKGDIVEGYTYKGDCIIYQKEKMTVHIYEYNDFELAKEEIMENYDQEKANGLITDFVSKRNYIKKEICYVGKNCNISIGNNKYFIVVFYNQSVKKEVNKILKGFLPNV